MHNSYLKCSHPNLKGGNKRRQTHYWCNSICGNPGLILQAAAQDAYISFATQIEILPLQFGLPDDIWCSNTLLCVGKCLDIVSHLLPQSLKEYIDQNFKILFCVHCFILSCSTLPPVCHFDQSPWLLIDHCNALTNKDDSKWPSC